MWSENLIFFIVKNDICKIEFDGIQCEYTQAYNFNDYMDLCELIMKLIMVPV